MSADCPNRCTGTIAFVLGVTSDSTLAGVKAKRIWINICKYRNGPQEGGSLGSGYKGKRRG